MVVQDKDNSGGESVEEDTSTDAVAGKGGKSFLAQT